MADYKNIIPFIQRWEGGMSNDADDTSAASLPMPCSYRGVMGWHTNKGITYRTFLHFSKVLGYEPTCANFVNMPPNIWGAIFKRGFWDSYQLDTFTSQAVAEVLVNIIWGSGHGGGWRLIASVVNSKQFKHYGGVPEKYSNANTQTLATVINKICRREEKKLHTAIIERMKRFYYSLNKPKYLKGWLNRLADLDSITAPLIGVQHGNVVAAGIGLALIAYAAITIIDNLNTSE
jgi:lysozyme family protein